MTSEVDGSSPNRAHYGKVTNSDHRMTAEEMDIQRQENLAYEYLCHLEEAKVWIEGLIKETLPPTTELEESLRNGVYLAKLANFMSPELVPLKKIFDKDQMRHQVRGLQFKHTDNINHFRLSLKHNGLPEIFWPETTDVYDKKNMPRVIYCIHALSLYLFKQGRAPLIQDLYGKIKFTDEEISAMSKELERYGIQMPAFGKIGGILANELPVDEAALHAAVIAINEAIEHQVPEDTLVALRNPAAHLSNVQEQLQQEYQHTLYSAKHAKAKVALNKSQDPDYIPDVYDELLTQAELQGFMNKVNTDDALLKLVKCLETGDRQRMLCLLMDPPLCMREVYPENVDLYFSHLLTLIDEQQTNNNNIDARYFLRREDVQRCVLDANNVAESHRLVENAVICINEALDGSDPEVLMRALQNPTLGFSRLMRFAATLYLQELKSMRAEKGDNLILSEIQMGVNVCSAIADINQAIDTGSASSTFQKMAAADTFIANLDESLKEKYFSALLEDKLTKVQEGMLPFLVYHEIQQCINHINDETLHETAKLEAIRRINEAIDEGPDQTLEALKLPEGELNDLNPADGMHYYIVLAKRKKLHRKKYNDPTAVLWYDDIQAGILEANAELKEGLELSAAVVDVNTAVENEDINLLYQSLRSGTLALTSFVPECTASYLVNLKQFKDDKASTGECGSGWMVNRLRSGQKFFFNVYSHEDFRWERHPEMVKDHSLLSREDIQICIREVTAAYDREQFFVTNEPNITKMQAVVRGYLARKHFQAQMQFMYEQLPAIVKIQSWWKMILVRRHYLQYIRYLRQNEDAVVVLQAGVRGFLARKRYRKRLQFFDKHVDSIVKIQAFIRSRWAKNDFQLLMHSANPPLNVVRKFVHLLDMGDMDYAEEIELQALKQQVVQSIRSNKQLEIDLDQMDIKIGLLVKNRITLQEVVLHHKSLKKYKEQRNDPSGSGLKTLSRQSRERLEAYQNLFYLLQTNPTYLARLLFAMPPSQTNKFMESVILTLYNYASNQREEFLLLKLFKTALIEEISSKVDKMSDIVTGNPMVVKMIVSFNRNARGQGALRELLNPLVMNVLEDSSMRINTNPVEVYKDWINHMESQTGQPSGLPYDVTTEQALQNKDVQVMLKSNIQRLQAASEVFLATILSQVDKIPYGMRYMAKVMRDALKDKFPDAPDKEILKIVGNLIYYRYINSAIVAPDAFDVVDVKAQKALTNDQRRNLGSIAKILQFAASNKGFGGDSGHLVDLNPYIVNAHTRFKRYLREICDVEEPEVHFNMDQYTDVSRVTKPVICISVAEVVDTHRLLLEYQDTVAPDVNDPLHFLLEDLGDTPSPDALVGDVSMDETGTLNRSSIGKTEVSLTLSNKFEIPEDDQSDLRTMFIRTKKMIIDVIRCQKSGDNLTAVLRKPVTAAEEQEHLALIKQRERLDANQRNKLVQQSFPEDTRLPLDSLKAKIQANLKELENANLVSQQDNYQDIVTSICQDIRNQRIHRQRRKQEMVRLKETLRSLAAKRQFYEEQVEFYNQYVKTCMDNLSAKSAGKSSRSREDKPGKSKSKITVKYSAARLHDKGVVLSIEGLPASQFKNVLFEISSTPDPGVFDVNCKFMGVNMEKVDLKFQDLLQLQYDGVAIMQMFEKAKINVNLLIFLINQKFYGKVK